MNQSHPPTEESLYQQAMELTSPAEREAFLIKACGGDAALLGKVRELLACDAEAVDQQFLPTVITDCDWRGGGEFPENYAEREGDVIGPYKLRQQIGEGGFGTVWMAEQSVPISRMVALKVIKAGMDTKQVLARFEAERQALAMMDHPNIAKVLDAGTTPTGRPWFAMELVKGIPITRFCDDQGFGTKARLALFGDVCAAINHAHQKGVIHRDIKPSNVMVTLHGDKPVVKVIDFGIAKATQGKLTDQTFFTRFDQFIGTPVYMSPEQAGMSGLDIDTRSDIYALGILLYELLVGKPPFDAKSLISAGYEEMRRIIREVEPVKPSSRLGTLIGDERTLLAKARQIEETKLHRLVEPDLDWIVMKAIEKDRTRRYETANAFAQDIVRFLADEAVTARPPSAGYQFRKFARRNKALLRVAAAIAAVLVAATAVSTWQAVRATRAEELAAQETKRVTDTLKEVAAERDAKEDARKDAEAVSKFMTDMFTRSQPGEEKGGREVKVVDVLDPAVAALEAKPDILPARRAVLQHALGDAYYALGLYPQAIPLHEKVRDSYLATYSLEHPATLSVMANLAGSYDEAGRLDEALKMREQVLALRRKVLGPEHPETLMAIQSLANSYSTAGRKVEALKMREEVLALSRKVEGPEHPLTLTAMNNLSESYSDAGRRDEALKLSEEVLPLRRKVSGPEHPSTLAAMNGLAVSYSNAGRKDEALKVREELLALSRKVWGPEHPHTLSARLWLAVSYSETGRKDEALKMLEEVLALSSKVLGPEHPDMITAMSYLADSYNAAGRKDEALKMREEVRALRRKVLGPERSDTLSAMANLAVSYSDAGRKDEALKMREEVLALSLKVNGPEHPDTLMSMLWLAISYFDAGRKVEALKIREEVLALSRKVHGPEHPLTLKAMNNLADSYSDAGRRDEALKLNEELLPLRRKVSGPEHPSTLAAMNNLAVSYANAGRKDDAAKLRADLTALRATNGPAAPPAPVVVPATPAPAAATLKSLEEALETVRTAKGAEAPETIAAMTGLAAAYGAEGSGRKAIKLGEEALALARRVLPAGDPRTVEAMKILIPLYRSVDLESEAAKLEAEMKAFPAPDAAPAGQ